MHTHETAFDGGVLIALAARAGALSVALHWLLEAGLRSDL